MMLLVEGTDPELCDWSRKWSSETRLDTENGKVGGNQTAAGLAVEMDIRSAIGSGRPLCDVIGLDQCLDVPHVLNLKEKEEENKVRRVCAEWTHHKTNAAARKGEDYISQKAEMWNEGFLCSEVKGNTAKTEMQGNGF